MTTQSPLINQKYLLEKYPGKGGWTYAIIPEIIQDKQSPFGWVKVKGFIDDYEFKNHNLMRLADGRIFFSVRAQIRKIIGKKEGDWVHIVLYPDRDPTEIPEEFLLCLSEYPSAHKKFLTYTDGKQKEFIDWIYSAKTEETKVARFAEAINRIIEKG